MVDFKVRKYECGSPAAEYALEVWVGRDGVDCGELGWELGGAHWGVAVANGALVMDVGHGIDGKCTIGAGAWLSGLIECPRQGVKNSESQKQPDLGEGNDLEIGTDEVAHVVYLPKKVVASRLIRGS